MVYLPQSVCTMTGSTALLGTAVCGYKSASKLYQTSQRDGSKPLQDTYMQRGFTALFGKADSKFSKIAREAFETMVVWGTPTLLLSAIACAALEPDAQYLPSRIIPKMTCLTCETPTYPDGSDKDAGRANQQIFAKLFPNHVYAPAPEWGEDKLQFMLYYGLKGLDHANTALKNLLPWTVFAAIGAAVLKNPSGSNQDLRPGADLNDAAQRVAQGASAAYSSSMGPAEDGSQDYSPNVGSGGGYGEEDGIPFGVREDRCQTPAPFSVKRNLFQTHHRGADGSETVTTGSATEVRNIPVDPGSMLVVE